MRDRERLNQPRGRSGVDDRQRRTLPARRLFIEYATNGRGYTLTCLAFMVLLLCGQGIVRRPEDPVRWGLFAAVAALGLFTHPIMVFPAAVATAGPFYFLRRRYRVRRCPEPATSP